MSAYKNDSDLIKDFLTKVGENIRKESIRQGRVATGRTINSIESLVTSAIGGQLQASVNILRTEYGTSPKEAQQESFNSLVEGLQEWKKAKGLNTLNEYALAHTLRKFGSMLWREGGNSGVLTKFIQDDQVAEFAETLALKYLQETNSLLFNDI